MVIYLLGAVMALSVGYVLAMRTLRRFAKRSQNSAPQPGFDMAELQSMFDKGLISADEFERLKLLTLQQRAQADAAKKLTGFEVIPMAKPHDQGGK